MSGLESFGGTMFEQPSTGGQTQDVHSLAMKERERRDSNAGLKGTLSQTTIITLSVPVKRNEASEVTTSVEVNIPITVRMSEKSLATHKVDTGREEAFDNAREHATLKIALAIEDGKLTPKDALKLLANKEAVVFNTNTNKLDVNGTKVGKDSLKNEEFTKRIETAKDTLKEMKDVEKTARKDLTKATNNLAQLNNNYKSLGITVSNLSDNLDKLDKALEDKSTELDLLQNQTTLSPKEKDAIDEFSKATSELETSPETATKGDMKKYDKAVKDGLNNKSDQVKLVVVESQIKHAAEKVESLTEKSDSLKEELNDVKKQIEEKQSTFLENNPKSSSVSKADMATYDKDITSLNKEYDALTKQLSKTDVDLNAAKMEEINLSNKAGNLKASIEQEAHKKVTKTASKGSRLVKSTQKESRAVKKLKSEIDKLTESTEQVQDELTKQQDKEDELLSKIAEETEKISDCHDHLNNSLIFTENAVILESKAKQDPNPGLSLLNPFSQEEDAPTSEKEDKTTTIPETQSPESGEEQSTKPELEKELVAPIPEHGSELIKPITTQQKAESQKQSSIFVRAIEKIIPASQRRLSESGLKEETQQKDLQTQQTTEPQPETQKDPQTQQTTEPQPETQKDPQTQQTTEPQPETQKDPQTQQTTEPQPETQKDPQTQQTTEPQPETKQKAKPPRPPSPSASNLAKSQHASQKKQTELKPKTQQEESEIQRGNSTTEATTQQEEQKAQQEESEIQRGNSTTEATTQQEEPEIQRGNSTTEATTQQEEQKSKQEEPKPQRRHSTPEITTIQQEEPKPQRRHSTPEITTTKQEEPQPKSPLEATTVTSPQQTSTREPSVQSNLSPLVIVPKSLASIPNYTAHLHNALQTFQVKQSELDTHLAHGNVPVLSTQGAGFTYKKISDLNIKSFGDEFVTTVMSKALEAKIKVKLETDGLSELKENLPLFIPADSKGFDALTKATTLSSFDDISPEDAVDRYRELTFNKILTEKNWSPEKVQKHIDKGGSFTIDERTHKVKMVDKTPNDQALIADMNAEIELGANKVTEKQQEALLLTDIPVDVYANKNLTKDLILSGTETQDLKAEAKSVIIKKSSRSRMVKNRS